jgi:hypothetical protein
MNPSLADGATVRRCWLARIDRLATPVLSAAAEGRLRATMTVERPAGHSEDGRPSALEALARTLAGLAPWLDLDGTSGDEAVAQARMRRLAVAALDRWSDPTSADHMPLAAGTNALVEAGFLGHALVRMPRVVAMFDDGLRRRLADQFVGARAHVPWFNNWHCFAALAELGLAALGGSPDRLRIDTALRHHETWYLGDGVYGDGPQFHADFYNSFVIQPMLLDLIRVAAGWHPSWAEQAAAIRARATRHADVQERLIGPDGSFPVLGRSIAYRCGAFQHLAQCALQDLLPGHLPPAQVRAALDAVQSRTLDPAGTWRADGFLTIGLSGAQPGLGEIYISTGSLYLCSTAFLPLGLGPAHPFWAAPARAWTGLAVWSGEDRPADHALHGFESQACWRR